MNGTKAPSFQCSRTDQDLIDAIVRRACHLAIDGDTLGSIDRLGLTMDLLACHNETPLNLAVLLASRKADFGHDVFGICRHLDRETGELQDCFWPRCGGRN